MDKSCTVEAYVDNHYESRRVAVFQHLSVVHSQCSCFSLKPIPTCTSKARLQYECAQRSKPKYCSSQSIWREKRRLCLQSKREREGKRERELEKVAVMHIKSLVVHVKPCAAFSWRQTECECNKPTLDPQQSKNEQVKVRNSGSKERERRPYKKAKLTLPSWQESWENATSVCDMVSLYTWF